MERLIRNPGKTLTYTFAACIAGFFAVGWLASIASTFGLSWRPFRPELGFAFAAAFAQLVLAGAVWMQIKTADDARRETKAAAEAHVAAAEAALMQAQAEAARTAERHHYQRAADSVATFVGHASNASIRYGSIVVSRLQDVVAQPASDSVERARHAIADADRGRQAAHAERFHIGVRTSDGDGEEVAAAENVLDAVDGQHRRATSIIAWANNVLADPGNAPSAPPCQPRDVYFNLGPLRDQCLSLAQRLLDKAR